MSDPQQPTTPPSPDGDSAPAGQPGIDWGKQIFIWTMIILVGVIFGVGPSIGMVLQPDEKVGNTDVSASEVAKRQVVARKLQAAINPAFSPFSGGPTFIQVNPRTYQEDDAAYAQRIMLATIADRRGLTPKGEVLDEQVKKFLNTPLRGNPGRTYRTALEEHQRGDKAVTALEVRRWVAEDFAVRALFASASAPAVPLTVADDILGLSGDRIEVDQVVLTAKHLLPEVKPDDPELQVSYDTLRAQGRFSTPPSVVVTVAHADVKALAERATVSEAEQRDYYEAHKSEFAKPAPTEAPKPADPAQPPPAAEYKPFEEVATGIDARLRKQAAEDAARQAVAAFDQSVAEAALEEQDAAAFAAAAAKAGLVVRSDVVVTQGESGTIIVGDLGQLKQTARQVGVFDTRNPIGWITPVAQSTGEAPTYLVMRVNERRDADARPLTDPAVLAEVSTHLAGERARKALLTAAEEARAAAEKLGPGGLRKYFADPAAAVWGATPDTATLQPTDSLTPPAKEGEMPDPRLAISLAMPERPVLVVDAPAQGDIPSVKLVQVSAYKAAEPRPEVQAARVASYMRQSLLEFDRRQISEELQREMER